MSYTDEAGVIHYSTLDIENGMKLEREPEQYCYFPPGRYRIVGGKLYRIFDLSPPDFIKPTDREEIER